MSSLHISISAETIGYLGPIPISNSMLTSLIVSGMLVLLAIVVGTSLKKTGKPNRVQALFEMIIEALFNLAIDITGSRKKAARFFPLVASFFLWIVLNNWLGLFPGVGTIGFYEEPETEHAQVISKSLVASTEGSPVAQEGHEVPVEAGEPISAETVEEHTLTEEEAAHAEEEHAEPVFVPYLRAGTADLNTTIALALISVGATQYFGFKALGFGYLKKYFNFSKNPILTIVGLLELILEFAKIMSFAFRLFGNIFAGEVLLAVMMFLVPIIVPMPFYGLELFVGMIQGLVFAMLSLVFFNLATIGHGEEH